jgi:DNA invertase Pin-like site-specific DNA recombinase
MTYEDAGISGGKGRENRPGFDALIMAVARREIDMVAAWSVDRLGRSLMDLLAFLRELHAKKVDLFLHQQGLDTSTPSGKAMFQMLGVFAEFERAMIRERVMAGLARARADGKQLGRPRRAEPGAKGEGRARAAFPRRWHSPYRARGRARGRHRFADRKQTGGLEERAPQLSEAPGGWGYPPFCR